MHNYGGGVYGNLEVELHKVCKVLPGRMETKCFKNQKK